MNEPEVRALIHSVVGPMFDERDARLKNRLDYQDRIAADQSQSLDVIKKHQLEMYGNGSGKPGMLENMRAEQKRMHEENKAVIDRRLKGIEDVQAKQDLRKDVMKELLDEQEATRLKREAITKRKWERGALIWRAIGGTALLTIVLRYAHEAWITHSLFGPLSH